MARVPVSMSHYRESDVYIDENANIGSKKKRRPSIALQYEIKLFLGHF